MLSTGGIFFLIMLVTVCACWTPSKKSRQKSRKSRIYGHSHHIQLKQKDDVLPKMREHNGIKAVTSLYVLQQKDPSIDDSSSNSIGSPSELDNPPSYTTYPKYTHSLVLSDASPASSLPKCI
ncbi:hypothetical protein ATANTOWER_012266 [Ataeniobius toweri]|uniref:Uncharacterized protein n=2 Tax=Goodeidae TaxID=28758 RepID=A0ABU7BZW8_9TELE|nr:hypothetical protein [Ataeniobius toweri]